MRRIVFIFMIIISLGVIIPTQAQRPDAPTYAVRGEYGVGTQEFVIEDDERPLKVSVWYPTEASEDGDPPHTYRDTLIFLEGFATPDAPIAASDAPYPVILFSHGSGGLRYQSLFFTEHLASYGFIVLAPDHPGNTVFDRVMDADAFADNILVNFALRPLDILRVIDFAETLNAEDPILAGALDMDNLAVTGHSFGGYTAMAIGGGNLVLPDVEAACAEDSRQCELAEGMQAIATLRGLDSLPMEAFPPTTDPRIQAVALLAPAGGTAFSDDSLTAVDIPVMVVVGSGDTVTPADRDARPIYEALGTDQKVWVALDNAGHYIFVNQCSELEIQFGFFGSCSDLVWDMQRAHDLINHYVTAFFLTTLQADADAQALLANPTSEFLAVDYQTTYPN